MWRVAALWLWLWLCGCGFSASLAGDVAGDAAALDTVVSGPDAIAVAPCTVHASGPPTDAPALGGDSGSERPDVVCAADELPIGLSFDVSQGGIDNHADQVAMVNLRVRCARITRLGDGSFATTPAAEVARTGGDGGNCSEYFPTVAVAEVACPAGMVLVGLRGNRLDSTLYNTVSIACAPLAADGTVGTGTVVLPIAGTGMETNQPQTADCPSGTAIARLGVRSGCGHDQLRPRCAPLVCD